MKTLEEAWEWFEAVRVNLDRMKRLGVRHWNDDSLKESSIWNDPKFKEVEATDLERETTIAIRPFDDLGVLVLFSVFEATVRQHLEIVVETQSQGITHPILVDAVRNVLEGIEHGSFANKVLKPLKSDAVTDELIDHIRQVRDFRNWVAHGRRVPRSAKVVNITPRLAFERLKQFLDTLGISAAPETD